MTENRRNYLQGTIRELQARAQQEFNNYLGYVETDQAIAEYCRGKNVGLQEGAALIHELANETDEAAQRRERLEDLGHVKDMISIHFASMQNALDADDLKAAASIAQDIEAVAQRLTWRLARARNESKE